MTTFQNRSASRGTNGLVCASSKRSAGTTTRPGILVVEDADMHRPVLVLWLERAGFRVWDTGDGPDALDLYEQHHDEINLVLLEAGLGPNPDGLELLEQLRRINPSLRCCFMTSNPWLHGEPELLDRGAEWVFQKPFTPAEVASMLWNMAGSPPRPLQLAATLR